MYKKLINTVFSLTILLVCLSAQAVKLPKADDLAFTSYYGKIDAVYPKEQIIIIHDMSFSYGPNSNFLGNSKKRVLKQRGSAQKGLYVKYHVESLGKSRFFLLDLQLISKGDFNAANARDYDN